MEKSRYSEFSLEERTAVCDAVLGEPFGKGDLEEVFDVLRPASVVQYLFNPALLLVVDEEAFVNSKLLLDLRVHLVEYWHSLPSSRRGARWPTKEDLSAEFGEPQWKLAHAVWPVVRFVVALTELSDDQWVQRDGEAHRMMSVMHDLILLGEPGLGGRRVLTRFIERTASRGLRVDQVRREEVVAAVLASVYESGRRRLTAFDPDDQRSLKNYYATMVRRMASDALAQTSRQPGTPARSTKVKYQQRGVDPIEEYSRGLSRQRHHDPDGSTLTVAQLAEALGRSPTTVGKALKEVENELQALAPREGRMARLTPYWVEKVKEQLKQKKSRRR